MRTERSLQQEGPAYVRSAVVGELRRLAGFSKRRKTSMMDLIGICKHCGKTKSRHEVMDSYMEDEEKRVTPWKCENSRKFFVTDPNYYAWALVVYRLHGGI